MSGTAKAYVQNRQGDVVEVPQDEVRAKLESGDFLPASAADKAAADKRERNSTLGAKAKTFAESAAAGAIDTLQAPVALPLRGAAALAGAKDPLSEIHGRKTVENLATIFGDATEDDNQTGEAYGQQYASNARDRAAENPGTATAGNVAGALVAGGALSGGAGAIGGAATKALGGGILARGAGAVAGGALEGAAYGQAQAGEEAYLHNIPLSGEKLIAAMGWGAVLGGGVSLATHAGGALLRRGSRGATPFDSPRLPDNGLGVPGESGIGDPLDAADGPAITTTPGIGAPKPPDYDAVMSRVNARLSSEDKAAIHDYTTTSYDGINKALRSPDEYLKQWGPGMSAERQIKIRKLQSLLEQQASAGHVYRGEVERVMDLPKETIDDWLSNGSVSNSSFWSTTANSEEMASTTGGKLRGNVRLHIADADAVPVGEFSKVKAEQEAIIPPGRTFFVDRSEVRDGVHHIWLEQVRPNDSFGNEMGAPTGDTTTISMPGKTGSADPLDLPTAAEPGRASSSLRNFADERTAKALGARGSSLKKLGRTAEQAESTMHDMAQAVRGTTLEDGSAVFRPFDSQPELADRVAQAKQETGAKLGAFREEADKVFEAHPEIAPNADAIADRIQKEIGNPLENHPLSAIRSQAGPIRQVANDLRELSSPRVGETEPFPVKVSDLTKLRQGLDDQIYQAKRGVNLTQQGAPPNLKDLERARGILEESIEAASDKAATFFDKQAAQSYKQLKAQYRHLSLASDIAGAAELQNLGNRVVSPSDYGAGAIGGVLGGGPVGALASTLAHKAVREHSSAVLAVLADKLANTLDGKLESGLGAFFRESTARASAGTAGLGKTAAAVPIRRITMPAAVDAFVGKHKDLATAYDKRVAELANANRDLGAGVRAQMQTAMGPAYEGMPRLTQAATVTATRGAQYLQAQLPSGTAAPTMFQPSRKITPSDLQIREFAQKWAAVANPLSVVDDLRRGTVTHAQIDALKNVYPLMYAEVQQKALEQIRELDARGKRMPFNDRLQLDLFLDLNGAGEPTLDGRFVDRVAAAQSAKQQQESTPKPHGSGAALTKISVSRQSGAQAALGG